MSSNLTRQLNALKKSYKGGKGRIIKCKNGLRLEWRQELQPSKFSRKYLVLIYWLGLNDIPVVEILAPNLSELSGGKRSPHEYNSKGNTKPCILFNNSKKKDWISSMLICDSIIPWTQEWLWYWELWLSDGKWGGGGVHPGELTIEEYTTQLKSNKLTIKKEKLWN